MTLLPCNSDTAGNNALESLSFLKLATAIVRASAQPLAQARSLMQLYAGDEKTWQIERTTCLEPTTSRSNGRLLIYKSLDLNRFHP
jgi:hypothetical protein